MKYYTQNQFFSETEPLNIIQFLTDNILKEQEIQSYGFTLESFKSCHWFLDCNCVHHDEISMFSPQITVALQRLFNKWWMV